MAIEKLFNVLVIGGVALGTQACKKKDPNPLEKSPNASKVEEVTSEVATAKETAPSAAETAEANTPGNELQLERIPAVNSKGEKCEEICSGEGISTMCADMCCWLQATECCPNYSPPIPTEPEESKGAE